MGELVLDPPPPPYTPLKSFFAFEDNVGDSGSNKLTATANSVTYTDGINGKSAAIGSGGYAVINSLNDTIKNIGSFTIAFWMKSATDRVTGGAQGVFAISNSDQFWGNLEIFLENNDVANEAFLKIHMLNASAADGVGEQWNELKIPGALGKWTHVAYVYDASTSKLTLYIDGTPTTLDKVLADGSYGNIKYNNATGISIGTFAFQPSPSLTNHGPEDWAKSFSGDLDQFRIYNVPLSAADVAALYTNKE